MENKAHYTLIGAFIIFLLISLVGFLIWLAKFDIDQKWSEYDIHFSESVAGLTQASPVSYNGIPVGEVREISILPSDPSKVLVTIRVKEETPVTEDTEATLGMQGITGVLFVQIMGGSAGSPMLTAKGDEERPVIPSRPSTLEEFFGGSGELIKNALETLDRVNQMLSDENIAYVTGTLANVDSLTGDLAAEGPTIQGLIQDLQTTVNEANKLFSEDLGVITGEAVLLVQRANSLVANLDAFVVQNSEGIGNFTNQGLPELQRLLTDLRALSQSLTALTTKLEERPSELIFKTLDPEYEVDR